MPHRRIQDIIDARRAPRRSIQDVISSRRESARPDPERMEARGITPGPIPPPGAAQALTPRQRLGRTLGTEGVRAGLQTAGFVAGGPVGGALAGAIPELPIQAAEMFMGTREPLKFAPGRIATEAAIGAIAPLKIAKGISTAAKVGRAALGGARVGVASAALTPIAEQGRAPTPQELLFGTTVGSVAGIGGFKLAGRKFGIETPEAAGAAARARTLAPTDIPPKPQGFEPRGRIGRPLPDEGLGPLMALREPPAPVGEIDFTKGQVPKFGTFPTGGRQGRLPFDAEPPVTPVRPPSPAPESPLRTGTGFDTTITPRGEAVEGQARSIQDIIDQRKAARLAAIPPTTPPGPLGLAEVQGRLPLDTPPAQPPVVSRPSLEIDPRGAAPSLEPVTPRGPTQVEPEAGEVQTLLNKLLGRQKQVPTTSAGEPIKPGLTFTEETTGNVGSIREVLDDGTLRVQFTGAPGDVIIDAKQVLNVGPPRRGAETAFARTGERVKTIADVKTGLDIPTEPPPPSALRRAIDEAQVQKVRGEEEARAVAAEASQDIEAVGPKVARLQKASKAGEDAVASLQQEVEKLRPQIGDAEATAFLRDRIEPTRREAIQKFFQDESGQARIDITTDLAAGAVGAVGGSLLNEENRTMGAVAGAVAGVGGLRLLSKVRGISAREAKATTVPTTPSERAFAETAARQTELQKLPSLQNQPLSVARDVDTVFLRHSVVGKGIDQRTPNLRFASERRMNPMIRTNLQRIADEAQHVTSDTELSSMTEVLTSSQNTLFAKRASQGNQSIMDNLLAGGANASPTDKIAFEIEFQSQRLMLNLMRKQNAIATNARTQMKRLDQILHSGDSELRLRALKTIGFRGRIESRLSSYRKFLGEGLSQEEAMFKSVEADKNLPGVFGDTIQAARFASMLSGIVTQERNAIGAGMQLLFDEALVKPFINPTAGVVSRLRGRPIETGFQPGESGARIAALPIAFSRGIRDGMFAFKHGVSRLPFQQSDLNLSNFELKNPNTASLATGTRFDTPRVDPFETSNVAVLRAFKYPGRGLLGMDQFFRGVSYEMERHGAAFSKAIEEGLAPNSKSFTSRVAELVTSDEKINSGALEYATRIVAQRENGLASLVQRAKLQHPILNAIIPFVRTPADIVIQGFEASPVGLLMNEASRGGRAGAAAAARISMGTMSLAASGMMVMSGIVTGRGPQFGTAERQEWLELGNRPYTINIPGFAPMEYKLLQPIAVPLAVIADALEGWRSGEGDTLPERMSDAAGKSWSRVGTSLISQSYFDSMFDLYTDFERGNFQGMQRILQSFLPPGGIGRDIARVVDPILREPATTEQKLASEIPGLSRSIPPRRERLGDPITRPGSRLGSLFTGPARALVSPLIGAGQPEVDPLVTDLAQRGIPFGKRSGEFTVEGTDVLKPFGRNQAARMRNLFQGFKGTALRGAITRLMATDTFKAQSVEEQNEEIKKVINNITRLVAQDIKEGGPTRGSPLARFRELTRLRAEEDVR